MKGARHEAECGRCDPRRGVSASVELSTILRNARERAERLVEIRDEAWMNALAETQEAALARAVQVVDDVQKFQEEHNATN